MTGCTRHAPGQSSGSGGRPRAPGCGWCRRCRGCRRGGPPRAPRSPGPGPGAPPAPPRRCRCSVWSKSSEVVRSGPEIPCTASRAELKCYRHQHNHVPEQHSSDSGRPAKLCTVTAGGAHPCNTLSGCDSATNSASMPNTVPGRSASSSCSGVKLRSTGAWGPCNAGVPQKLRAQAHGFSKPTTKRVSITPFVEELCCGMHPPARGVPGTAAGRRRMSALGAAPPLAELLLPPRPPPASGAGHTLIVTGALQLVAEVVQQRQHPWDPGLPFSSLQAANRSGVSHCIGAAHAGRHTRV